MAKNIKLYAIPNPMWLADTFVFGNIKSEWSMGPVDEWFYIKVNSSDKIEEIGVHIDRRMHYAKMEDILANSEEPTRKQKSLFNGIDEEYWANILSNYNRSTHA